MLLVQLDKLPLELLDDILNTALLLMMVGEVRLNDDRICILNLASVDKCWFKRITRKRFKKKIWRHLTGILRTLCYKYLFIIQLVIALINALRVIIAMPDCETRPKCK